jgi:apolipoprotein N-acyltransferase
VTRLGLRTTALVDGAFAFVLLVGTWDRLYDALDLPSAHEPFYGQVGGAFVVGMAYLLWHAHGHPALEQGVARAAGIAHALAAGVAIAWLLDTGSDVGSHSGKALILLAAVFAFLALLDFRIARRRRAQPLHAS